MHIEPDITNIVFNQEVLLRQPDLAANLTGCRQCYCHTDLYPGAVRAKPAVDTPEHHISLSE